MTSSGKCQVSLTEEECKRVSISKRKTLRVQRTSSHPAGCYSYGSNTLYFNTVEYGTYCNMYTCYCKRGESQIILKCIYPERGNERELSNYVDN